MGMRRAPSALASLQGTALVARILSGLAGRSLRRRIPARHASRHARAAATRGFAPLRLP